MRSDRIAKCFADIVKAADLIRIWVDQAGGADRAVRDVLVRSGIERQLLVISEAAVRLHKLDSVAGPTLAPELDWPGIRGIGNFIRHRYDDLDSSVLTAVLDSRIVQLRTAAEQALARLAAGN